ncbi:hypothetical protein ASPVEDRAFT_45928 [Aspergillus versicolor CBS 583.65]|uniref:Uncharacterized protein n=1 Tax=Aspergillus versicolor CBS 583.65 TaxID=1036611 RepID=A0A1L9PYF1_ASPVE|nr:uncharacterized protein ASPVEDRAFT_45928 [Aspergillus versicolor CBS 583.65]OJJ06571.1 hypothetical protein ASPVEDRAFT_45928 [Aspergillus versicolor CBS 583.65]
MRPLRPLLLDESEDPESDDPELDEPDEPEELEESELSEPPALVNYKFAYPGRRLPMRPLSPLSPPSPLPDEESEPPPAFVKY